MLRYEHKLILTDEHSKFWPLLAVRQAPDPVRGKLSSKQSQQLYRSSAPPEPPQLHLSPSLYYLQADLHQSERLLERGEQQLLKWKHPDPYIGEHKHSTVHALHMSHQAAMPAAQTMSHCAVAYAPGGSLFQRNPPFPPEVI